MKTVTRTSTRSKPSSPKTTTRTVRHVADLAGQGEGIVITKNGTSTSYWVDAIKPAFGTAAFTLEKVSDAGGENETHDVLLDGRHSTCTCKDFVYRSWKTGPCKHILACTALVAAGKLKPTGGTGEPRVDDLAEND